MLKEQLQNELSCLNQQIHVLKKELSLLPDQQFYCESAGKYIRWYIRDKFGKKYMSKKEKDLAYKLVNRKYFSLLLEDLENEKAALENYLETFDIKRESTALLESSRYKKLLDESLNSRQKRFVDIDYGDNNEYIQKWLSEEFEPNPYPNPYADENNTYRTSDGHVVRSKSEMLICECLCKYNIPYRYEAPFEISFNYTVYPDFTILNPRTLKIFYWEHFGRMDDHGYKQHTISKLDNYINNSVIPGINFITTYETKKKSIDMVYLEFLIKYYLL